ncbi:MSHA biogenesis protein MshK [Vibrio sp. SA48]|uniref:MSHA biogenesis protein MshK n=1 Tax=Vibrio sp. S12_S33 TaxID=2720223 RepID=UPI0017861BE8|nr:MSHA biogenesis protein MshK [Vibrio sp. S12_S33]MBD1565214.1 MSHA biogenesis protein MshK [Vibrio sp. S12_S33]
MVAKVVFSLLLSAIAFHSWATQDPTAPLGWVEQSVVRAKKVVSYPLPTLQSITCQQKTPCVAVLNDEVITVGESLRGYTVQAIEPQQVTLSRGGRLWNLGLFSLDIKQ